MAKPIEKLKIELQRRKKSMKSHLLIVAAAILAGGALHAQEQPSMQLRPAQAGQATIDVSEASYGSNLRLDQVGNATKYVKQECDGKVTCNFPVSHASDAIGDASPNQKKDFVVTYLCGDTPKKGSAPAEAKGQTVTLTCK